MKTILHVVGARPNFMKAAPVWDAIQRFDKFKQILVHTGQHYDNMMSEIFFTELNLPLPKYNLDVGSGSHAQQTALIMTKLEKVLLVVKPDLVIVYGDVNSTVAASLVCSKISIPLAHVEAGLRSFDRRMPEEINRLVTDQLADYLFTPSEDGDLNLKNEGIKSDKIFFVGNVMIDTLIKLKTLAEMPEIFSELNEYILVTLHRPSNVDNINNLESIISNLLEISKTNPVVFPVHPRTKHVLQKCNINYHNHQNFYLIDPLGYLQFLGLIKNAKAVITDSGGIQEETTWLGIPCITVRENTERPITITVGTNQLIGLAYSKMPQTVNNLTKKTEHKIPPLWDGKAADRIADIIKNHLLD